MLIAKLYLFLKGVCFAMKRIWIYGFFVSSTLLSFSISQELHPVQHKNIFFVPSDPPTLQAHRYVRTDLISDGSLSTPQVNHNLINPCGLAAQPNGVFRIANTGSGTSSSVVAFGWATADDIFVSADGSAHATGLVYNDAGAFLLQKDGVMASSVYLFVTLEGQIIGWNPDVDQDHGLVAVDNRFEGASYTGAALVSYLDSAFLYVANFSQGRVDVFDWHFQQVNSFIDSDIYEDYAPFGIAHIQGKIFVSFAPKSPISGKKPLKFGNGVIGVFSEDGNFLYRFAVGGELNKPWAMIVAHQDFGPLRNKLLVGNFGDGRILGYNMQTREFVGEMRDETGAPLIIDGIWGLAFGNGEVSGGFNNLYFTAGVGNEQHGVFGEIKFTN